MLLNISVSSLVDSMMMRTCMKWMRAHSPLRAQQENSLLHLMTCSSVTPCEFSPSPYHCHYRKAVLGKKVRMMWPLYVLGLG